MNRKNIGVYSIILGIAVIIIWMIVLMSGNVPEGTIEMSFHLFSEFLMALFAIGAGLLLLRKSRRAGYVAIGAHSMALYSVLNAAGHYGQLGGIVFFILFMVLAMFSAACIIVLLKTKSTKSN